MNHGYHVEELDLANIGTNIIVDVRPYSRAAIQLREKSGAVTTGAVTVKYSVTGHKDDAADFGTAVTISDETVKVLSDIEDEAYLHLIVTTVDTVGKVDVHIYLTDADAG